MDRKLFYEAPEAECLVVSAERRFLIDSLTDFDEQAKMTSLKNTSEGGTWDWE